MDASTRACCAALLFLLTACGSTPVRDAGMVTHPSPGLSPEDIQNIPAGLPALSAEGVQRKRAFGEPVALVDVRGPQERARLRIPGSLHLPYYELQSRQGEVPRDRLVVLYCGGGDCPLSRWATHKLREWGWTNVYELTGGIDAWRERGFPTEGEP